MRVPLPAVHWLHQYDGQILRWNKEWNCGTVICTFDNTMHHEYHYTLDGDGAEP